MDRSRDRLDAAFSKLNVPFWCFHDFDLASEGASVGESEENLRALKQRRHNSFDSGDGERFENRELDLAARFSLHASRKVT